MSQFWSWQWWSLIYSLLPYIMNTPRVPIGTGTHSGPLGCQRRWWGGVGVDVEAVVESKETQVVMLGGTQGSTHHAVVPPHCAGSSSVPPPPVHVVKPERKKRERKEDGKGWKEDRTGEEVIVVDFGWTEDMSPLFASIPVRISWQNEVLSGPLHPHNVIRILCLIYFKLCGATLHFGVPEWLQELACLWCTAGTDQS